MIAKIVIDLGFGDSGKGISTDFLCSRSSMKYSKDFYSKFFNLEEQKIVVRFSGGQQAGHSVWINNINHVHSNFGSGTLRGIPTYFSEHCTIYPLTIMREQDVLLSKGITPKLVIHPMAKVTTPYDVIYGRIREEKNLHGSCGLGVGSTMNRNNTTPYKLYAIDLFNRKLLYQKLNKIYLYYLDLYNQEDKKKFNDLLSNEISVFIESLDRLKFDVKSYNYLKSFSELIFEGSQGILLDMDHGIFPNVTYSNTTSKNAIEVCEKLNITNIEIYYVTRCYQTRHGNGWMSNDKKVELINTENEINKFNGWQGNFRIGEIDYDLLNYSLDIDNIYSEQDIFNTAHVIKKNLIVTCIDQRPLFTFDYNKLKYKFNKIFTSHSPDSKDMMEISLYESVLNKNN